jgi:hypothetical protein
MFTIITETGERPYVPAFLSSGSDHRVLVVGGADGYSSGPSPSNVSRNAWETVVL